MLAWSLTVHALAYRVQADVPTCRTHRYEAAIDIVPQSDSRSGSRWLKPPLQLVTAPSILKQVRCFSSSNVRLGDLRCQGSDGRKLDWTHFSEIAISVEWSPFTELREPSGLMLPISETCSVSMCSGINGRRGPQLR